MPYRNSIHSQLNGSIFGAILRLQLLADLNPNFFPMMQYIIGFYFESEKGVCFASKHIFVFTAERYGWLLQQP